MAGPGAPREPCPANQSPCVCGRHLRCKRESEQLAACGQALSKVRPLRCSIHALRAHTVFVEQTQIAQAACLTALRLVLGSRPRVSDFWPYVVLRPIAPSGAIRSTCPQGRVGEYRIPFPRSCPTPAVTVAGAWYVSLSADRARMIRAILFAGVTVTGMAASWQASAPHPAHAETLPTRNFADRHAT